MPSPIQYCLVGTLFLISAAIMAVSSFLGHTRSKLDILVVVVSAISFVIACDQFRRAFVVWHAARKKANTAVESNPGSGA